MAFTEQVTNRRTRDCVHVCVVSVWDGDVHMWREREWGVYVKSECTSVWERSICTWGLYMCNWVYNGVCGGYLVYFQALGMCFQLLFNGNSIPHQAADSCRPGTWGCMCGREQQLLYITHQLSRFDWNIPELQKPIQLLIGSQKILLSVLLSRLTNQQDPLRAQHWKMHTFHAEEGIWTGARRRGGGGAAGGAGQATPARPRHMKRGASSGADRGHTLLVVIV